MPPLTIEIEGVRSIINDQEETYMCNTISNGIAPYTYNWLVKSGQDLNWQKISTNSQATLKIDDDGSRTVQMAMLEVTATTTDGRSASETIHIAATKDNDGDGNPDGFITEKKGQQKTNENRPTTSIIIMNLLGQEIKFF